MRLTLLFLLLPLVCCSGPESLMHPVDIVRFPTSVVADPDGRYVYVLNSNFDLSFIGGSVSVIDTQTNRVVTSDGTGIGVGGYGGQLAIVPGADGDASGILVTDRDNDQITFVDIGERDDSSPPVMSCDILGDDGFCTGYATSSDPFGVAVKPARNGEAGHAFVTTFDGQISIFRIGDTVTPDRSALSFLSSHAVDAGAYGMAVHPVSGVAYSTSKFANSVYTLRIADPEANPGEQASVDVARSLIVSNGTGGSDFGRGIAFSQNGQQLYVAYRSPPALVIIDTSIAADGSARNEVVDAVPLASGPAAVAVAPAGPAGEERVIVTMYDQDMFAVLDPAARTVIHQAKIGDGPFDVTVSNGDGRLRAYVSLFEESAVSVIELLPGASQFSEIARIR
ncbi:MAG: hypothetical protein VX223_13375 [Myxococcota bacterium]|nr:hypothetical protein [Myxococcota bacterium]